jgi:hypothetical protein
MPPSRRQAHAWYSPVIWPQMADTVDLAIAAWSPSASARVASTSRTGRPRMNEAITRDSSTLVLVTWLPNRREAKASLAPRSLGRAKLDRPSGGLDRHLRVPVAGSRASGQAAARW